MNRFNSIRSTIHRSAEIQSSLFAIFFIALFVLPHSYNKPKSTPEEKTDKTSVPKISNGGTDQDQEKKEEDDTINIDWLNYPQKLLNYLTGLKKEDYTFICIFLTFFLTLLNALFGWENIRRRIAHLYNRLIFPRRLKYFKAHLLKENSQIKIPFHDNKSVEMEKVYISPTSSYSENTIDTETQKLSTKDIISEFDRTLIFGEPGSGKSLLCANILYNYSSGHVDWKEIKLIPVLITLYNLGELSSIHKEIQGELKILKLSDNSFHSFLQNGKFLIMFDGFDEIKKVALQDVIVKLKEFITSFPNNKYIVTCRSSVYDKDLDELINNKVIIDDLEPREIYNYLVAYTNNDFKKVTKLRASLRNKSPNIKHLAKNPMMLALMAYLVIEKNKKLPEYRGELYSDAIDLLLIRKNIIGQSQIPNLNFNDCVRIFRKIALKMLISGKTKSKDRVLDKDELINVICQCLECDVSTAKNFINRIILKTAILIVVDRGNEFFKFAHLSLQEYFAALEFKSTPNELISRFLVEPDKWREVVKIWCNISDNENSQFIKKVNDIDEITSLECTAETPSNSNLTYMEDTILKFCSCQLLGRLEKRERNRVIKALGVIASKGSDDGIGEFTFSILKKNLNSKIEFKYISQILAYSNTIEAVEILIAKIKKYPEMVLESLQAMGELSIPFLMKLCTQGELNAVKCLMNIGTDEAISCLIELMWQEEDVISYQAAWYFSHFLKEKSLDLEHIFPEENLNNLDLSKPYYNWVWKPFDRSESTPLYYLAGRAAYLIDKSTNQPNLSIDKMEIHEKISLPIIIHKTEQNINLNRIDRSLLHKDRWKPLEDIAYNKPTKPTKQRWIDIKTNLKGSSNYFSYFNSDYFQFSILMLVPFLSLAVMFYRSNLKSLGFVVVSWFIVLSIFYVLYGLRLNSLWINKKESKLGTIGIVWPLFEIPMYVTTFLLLFAINTYNFQENGGYEAWLSVLFIDFLILVIVILVLLAVGKERNSVNPLLIFLNKERKTKGTSVDPIVA